MDECESGDNECEEMCTNTEGGYECSCEEGRQLGSDEKSCEDIEVSIVCISPYSPIANGCLTNMFSRPHCSSLKELMSHHDFRNVYPSARNIFDSSNRTNLYFL